jgi:S1-C subfamily serine protease
LDQTLTTGVISGLGREIKSMSGRPITDVIQTDASINPGNSGGPLLDSSGRLIGINTAIYSPTGSSAGIGFAVPVDTVNAIVPQLLKHGKVVRPGLGIVIANDALAQRFGVDGVIVYQVAPNGAAARAGIEGAMRDPATGAAVAQDIIVGIDNIVIHKQNDLYKALDNHKVGDVVDVHVENRTTSKRRTVKVTLQAVQ